MSRNLGLTSLPRKRRSADPMRSFDALPAPLRQWLARAMLPWSPVSARRVWDRARAKGLGVEDALSYLSQAEARTIARDRLAASHDQPAKT